MVESLQGGRYKIIAVLGVGGFGQTYLAEDTTLEALDPVPVTPDAFPDPASFLPTASSPYRQCVIKQFKPTSQDVRFLEVARRLFDTEVMTLKRLGQHPKIPDFLNFFEEDGEFYLVQEFVAGHSLSYEFATFGNFTEGQAIALLRDTLPILEFVHSNQVIHRDIKPGNLLRRQADHSIVLIDFGAVKEIQTQLNTRLRAELGQTSFTVGIGTQGYSPSEQLAGQPRFCSDLYALGVTTIQAITRLHPTQLPVNPETGELEWQDYAVISSGFAAILDRMVRYHFSQRYQSAQEVLLALNRLLESGVDATDIPSPTEVWSPSDPSSPKDWVQAEAADALESRDISSPKAAHWMQDETHLEDPSSPPLASSRSVPEPSARRSLPNDRRLPFRLFHSHRLRRMVMTTVLATGLTLGIRQLGWLQPGELSLYDQQIRLRPVAPPDPRLLIVGISESDLRSLQRPTPSDRDVAQVIQTLQQYQPAVIGMDLHRELPQEPGQAELQQQLQADNVVAILKLGQDGLDIPPPRVMPPDRVGFSDIPIDPDGVARRNLMFASIGRETYTSFATQVAFHYLHQQGILPTHSAVNADHLQLQTTVFVPLAATAGGYQGVDAAGYQILLDYRSGTMPAQLVSFSAVLNNQLEPQWVKDRIVLLGTTATSGKDLFYTPFSASFNDPSDMPGILIHAHMIRQILGATLDGTPLFRFLPEWGEWLWIVSWAAAGSLLSWRIRRPLLLGMGAIGLWVLLGGTVWLLFLNAVWLPALAPGMALTTAIVVMIAYRTVPEE